MIDIQNIFNSIQSVVCLNGEFPKKKFFRHYSKVPLIACDGASSRLINQDLYPDLIIGDLDSIDYSVVPKNIEIIHAADQNYTDFEKTLAILAKKELFPCLVCGTTGKEIDHVLQNINVIFKYSKQHQLLFHDSANRNNEKFGVFVFDNLRGHFRVNTIMSILPFPNANISTQGLKWNLSHNTLSQNTKSSVRNVVESSSVEIIVHQGVVLVLFEL